MPKRRRSAGESSPSSRADDSIANEKSSNDIPEKLPENLTSAESAEASKHKVGKKKRKRSKKNEANRKNDCSSTSAKRSGDTGKKCILNGLTLAVTTLDKKREDTSAGTGTDAQQLSWKNTIDKCKQYGANITSQVHKRVHALIVSDAAVRNATQRVRKAIKLGIPIVDVSWVEACIRGGKRVDWADYLRDDEAKEAADSKKKAGSSGGEGCDVKFDIGNDANATSGWSEPVELDCCCVCHENGDLACPWCTGETECNLTKKRLGKDE